jgi:hypothetical protein
VNFLSQLVHCDVARGTHQYLPGEEGGRREGEVRGRGKRERGEEERGECGRRTSHHYDIIMTSPTQGGIS